MSPIQICALPFHHDALSFISISLTFDRPSSEHHIQAIRQVNAIFISAICLLRMLITPQYYIGNMLTGIEDKYKLVNRRKQTVCDSISCEITNPSCIHTTNIRQSSLLTASQCFALVLSCRNNPFRIVSFDVFSIELQLSRDASSGTSTQLRPHIKIR